MTLPTTNREATPDLILASASPRRRELLAQLGLRCRVVVPDVDERPLEAESPADYVLRLARDKAAAGARLASEIGEIQTRLPLVAADTAVVIDGQPLGKPTDADAAIAMLTMLSGREHLVLTGVAVVQAFGAPPTGTITTAVANCPTEIGASEPATTLSLSRVRLRSITAAEAAAYWATGEPADKAGGYGIQGLGALFVEEIQGSFSGVVGLPLFETARLLERFGLDVLGRGSA
jgi:septum formation protein